MQFDQHARRVSTSVSIFSIASWATGPGYVPCMISHSQSGSSNVGFIVSIVSSNAKKMSGYTRVAQHFPVHFLWILYPSTTCRKTSDAPISCSEPMASLQLRVRPCLRLPLPPLPPLHLHFHHFHHFRLLLPLPNPQTISLPALESVDPKPTLNAKLRIALSSWHFMTAKCQNILPISPPWRLTKARRSTDFRIPKHIKIRQYRTEWRVSRIFL